MSSVGPNEAACFGPRTKLSKACNSPPDQNRLPETVLGPFQDRTKSAVTGRGITAQGGLSEASQSGWYDG